jgi:hypothetical protein
MHMHSHLFIRIRIIIVIPFEGTQFLLRILRFKCLMRRRNDQNDDRIAAPPQQVG